MMVHQRKISTIIPLYNGEKYIKEALESVFAQKKVKADEIIVVDDGSTDNGAEIVKSFGPAVKLFCQKHSGIGATRNLGLKRASGDFFALLDADDLWTEDHLYHLLKPFRNRPELSMTFGKVEQFANQKTDESKIPENQRVLHGLLAGSGLIRKEAFERAGYFDPTLKVGEFLEWYSRAIHMQLQSETIPEVVLKRRIHDRNTGILQKKNRSDYIRVLFKHLKRKGISDE